MKATRILIFLFSIHLLGCVSQGMAQKDKVKGKSNRSSVYDEDLKKVRPTYPTQEELAEQTELEKQETPEPTEHQNVEVKQRLDEIAEKNAQLTKAQGYRILLYVGQSKVAAEQALKQFKEWELLQQENTTEEYRSRASYLVYKAPNFRLKIGDFRENSTPR